MDASIIQLADEVVTALNGHAFSLPFAAERGYLPTFDLPEMQVLKVTVVPKEDEGRLDARTLAQHDYSLDVGVQQKPADLTNLHLDPLSRLVQEIADFFLFGRQLSGHTLIAPQVRILYLPEHLQKLRQFTSVITLKFRGWREAA